LYQEKTKKQPFASENFFIFKSRNPLKLPFFTTPVSKPEHFRAERSSNAEWVIRRGVGCAQGEVTCGQGEGPGDAPGD
jgi:hypothetical protein